MRTLYKTHIVLYAMFACLLAGSLLWSVSAFAQDAEPSTDAIETDAANNQPETDVVVAPPAFVDVLESDGDRHLLTALEIVYTFQVDGQPLPEEILQAQLLLAKAEDGYVAPRRGELATLVRLIDLPTLENQFFYDSALVYIAPAIVEQLQALGFIGVYVEPDPEQIRVQDGDIVDDRDEDTTHLTIQITTGVVVEVRSNAQGERFEGEDSLNHEMHRRIRENSPVRALEDIQNEDREQHSALLNRKLLDDYVYLMNRHPGRRVDVALVPEGSMFGGVSLDYLITENKPVMFYAQLANTGTAATSELQERIGFIHNQFTGNDDILSFDYLTGDFDDVHAVNGSYDTRLFNNDRLRGRVYGSWYQYTAAEVGQALSRFEGDGYSIGGELLWNVHQDRDYFVDFFTGLRFEAANVNNQLTVTQGEGEFLLPSVGLRAERLRKSERIRWSVWGEGNVLGNDQPDLIALGRLATDEQWTALKYSTSYSFYIEPLLSENPNEPTSLAHEIALSSNGQWSEDRLPPNYLQVAGGLHTVRGYPQSIVSGDTTILASAEYRYHIPQGLSPKPRPGYMFGSPFRYAPQYVSGPTDWDLILKGFVDFGYVDRSNATALETSNTLLSTGFGLELEMNRKLRGEVNFGWALHEVENGGGFVLVDEGDFEVQFIVTFIF